MRLVLIFTVMLASLSAPQPGNADQIPTPTSYMLESYPYSGQTSLTCPDGTPLPIPLFKEQWQNSHGFLIVRSDTCANKGGYSATYSRSAPSSHSWALGSFSATRTNGLHSDASVLGKLYYEIERRNIVVKLAHGTGIVTQPKCNERNCTTLLFWKDASNTWLYALSIAGNEIDDLVKIANSFQPAAVSEVPPQPESELISLPYTSQYSLSCPDGRELKIPAFMHPPPRPESSWFISSYNCQNSSSSYSIYLGVDANCTDAHVCTDMTFRSSQVSLNNTEQYTEQRVYNVLFEQALRLYAPVSLSREHVGIVIPAICGAYCGETSLLWRNRDKSFFYMVGSKGNNEAELIKAANSFIDQPE